MIVAWRIMRRVDRYHAVMSTALVHEWLTTPAGSEAVLAAIAERYPDAPIYTMVHDPKKMAGHALAGRTIHTSWIQKLPGSRTRYRSYLPLMPFAVECLDLDDYDLVISSNHAVAKGVVTRSDQLHISYVHSPIRYAWDLRWQYLKAKGLHRGLRGLMTQYLLHRLRKWDQLSANRVDLFIANSSYIARRIWRAYRRRALTIYPPVEVEHFSPAESREDYYITVGRFVPYKRTDLIVETFSKLDKPLVVIGDGPGSDQLKQRAGRNVTFLGWQSRSKIAEYLSRARAFIFAADEDFGIAPVEAQAAGCPVIAYRKGGAIETVIEGKTGLFFDEQSQTSLSRAVETFEETRANFDPGEIAAHAQQFSSERFRRQFAAVTDLAQQAFAQHGDVETADYQPALEI